MKNLFSTPLSEAKPWFLSLIDQVRESRTPVVPVEITAAPVEVAELWSPHKAAVPRSLSVLFHAALVTVALVPWVSPPQQLPKGLTSISLYTPMNVILPMTTKSGGGGGGGKQEKTRASHGQLPRAADRQFVPPSPETPKNLDPTLIVESTIVAPQLAAVPRLELVPIGDPSGIPGPPSSGTGKGGGIGNDGNGRGVGEGDGPGFREGEGGGTGGGRFSIGGGVTTPVLISDVKPEYSEEARKARYQGTVILDTTVMPDGSVRVNRITRAIGYGLDEKAIAAVLKWKFRPGRKNNQPVPVALFVEVNFNLR